MSTAKQYTMEEVESGRYTWSRKRLRATVEAVEAQRKAAEANMALAERNADTIDRLCDERDALRWALRDAMAYLPERVWPSGLGQHIKKLLREAK